MRNPTQRRILVILGSLAGAVALTGLVFVAWQWLWFFHQMATLPPLNWDVVNAKGSDCQLFDRRQIRNGEGMVAVLREANCPGYWAQGIGYYVVFVHAVGEPNTKNNLAFQYTPELKGHFLSPYPTIVWRESNWLEVNAAGIDRIMVQKDTLGGVRVEYKLGEVWPEPTDGTDR